MNNLNADLVHKTKNESIDGNKTFLQKIIGSITGTAGSALKLFTKRTVHIDLNSNEAAEFDGSQDIYPGTFGILKPFNGGTGNSEGKAPSATKLNPGRKINGVLFDGSKDINLIDPTAVHKTGNELVDGTKTFKQTIKQDMVGRPASRLTLYSVKDDNYDGTVISMLACDTYGHAVGLGSGGLTLIGGGEAASSYLDALVAKNTPIGSPSTASSENAVVVSDSSAFILSGYQNGGATGKLWEFTTGGMLNKWINGKAVNVIKADGIAAKANVAYDIASTSGTFQMWYGMNAIWHKSGRVVTIKGFLNKEIPAGKHLTSTEALPDFLRPAGTSVGSVGMWGKDIKGYMFIETTGQMSCDDGMYSKANLNWTYIAKNANMK